MSGAPTQAEAIPDLETLAQLAVFLRRRHSQQETSAGRNFFSRRRLHRRSLRNRTLRRLHRSSGQSRFPASRILPGLAAGVYHFGAAEFGLRQLRSGDFRQALADATGSDASVAHAPVTIICTGTYWRNAWKYHSRTYRHFGWDNGTILANLLAMSAASNLPAQSHRRFRRLSSERLARRSTPSAKSHFLWFPSATRRPTPPSSPHNHAAGVADCSLLPAKKSSIRPCAKCMKPPRSIRPSEVSVVARQKNARAAVSRTEGNHRPSLQPLDDSRTSHDSIEQVISRRGSTRQFARDPITLPQLSTMLDRATRGIPADFLDPLGSHLNDLYLIVNNVLGLHGRSLRLPLGTKSFSNCSSPETFAKEPATWDSSNNSPPMPPSMCSFWPT